MLKNILMNNKYIMALYKAYKNEIVILFHKVNFKPRWEKRGGNPHLLKIIASNRNTYEENINQLSEYKSIVDEINAGSFPFTIRWDNGFFPAFDGISLMWAASSSKATYMEIGSGNSTMFVKAALLAKGRSTKIISIDPHPTAEIDVLCDELIRQPLETIDPSFFEQLLPGDTLFFDGSHTSYMNSDVTTFMLDVLPLIKRGVLVGIHDIFFPYDYYSTWAKRGYNEQYLLASYLLSNPNYFDIQLPNFWIHQERMHHEPLKNIWGVLGDQFRDRAPSTFWIVKN